MTMTAHDDPAFREVVNGARLVVPDGVPMVWALRALGAAQRRRVRVAPDLVIELLAAAELDGTRSVSTVARPTRCRRSRGCSASSSPALHVAYAWSPPFRPLTAVEDDAVVSALREARVGLLLVGIGCPKQERWMAAHADRLGCVMVGVGAAFDMLGGRTADAPAWLHDTGLEWVYRLASEPRRLWRRYLVQNPRFMALFVRQLLRSAARRP